MLSFQVEGTKLERFLLKNQHSQRKLLNFENWCSGEVSKSAKVWLLKSIFYVKNHPNLSHSWCKNKWFWRRFTCSNIRTCENTGEWKYECSFRINFNTYFGGGHVHRIKCRITYLPKLFCHHVFVHSDPRWIWILALLECLT